MPACPVVTISRDCGTSVCDLSHHAGRMQFADQARGEGHVRRKRETSNRWMLPLGVTLPDSIHLQVEDYALRAGVCISGSLRST
jgi:hypothetical protein